MYSFVNVEVRFQCPRAHTHTHSHTFHILFCFPFSFSVRLRVYLSANFFRAEEEEEEDLEQDSRHKRSCLSTDPLTLVLLFPLFSLALCLTRRWYQTKKRWTCPGPSRLARLWRTTEGERERRRRRRRFKVDAGNEEDSEHDSGERREFIDEQ